MYTFNIVTDAIKSNISISV